MEKTTLFFSFLKRFSFFVLFSLILSLLSCSNSEESDAPSNIPEPYVCSTCKATPEALPENDNSFKGIYAGVGVSDIVYFDIDNKGDGMVKSFVMRGNVLSQFPLVTQWSDENKYYYIFKGRINYGHHEVPLINLNFSVDLDGKNPQFSFERGILYKDQVSSNIVKEKSNELIEIFDGLIIQKIVRIIVGDDVNAELTDSKVRGETTEVSTQIIGTERYVVSRSKGYWYSVSSGLSTNGEILPSISNHGTIVNGNLIGSNNEIVGKLNHDSFTGKILIQELGEVSLTSKRVL